MPLKFYQFCTCGRVNLVYMGAIGGLHTRRPVMSLTLQQTLALNMLMLLGLNVLLSLGPHMINHSLCLGLGLSYHALSLLASFMDDKLSLGLDMGSMFFGLGS